MEKKKIEFPQYASEMLQVLKEGRVLLVAQGKDGTSNPMTIAWGSMMFAWNKPIFVVMVRDSRYTYKLMEESDSFTVNFFSKEYGKEMGFCGTKSGRDYDKWKETNLTPVKGKAVAAPVIEEGFLNVECKVIFTNEMDPACLDRSIIEQHYQKDIPGKTYHKLYYGEIVEMYGDLLQTENI